MESGMTRAGLLRWVFAWIGVALLAGPGAGVAQQAAAGSTVYLVRHAERAADHPSDPTLTPAGSARAALLARMLQDVPLVSVLATDYRRTRLTAGPVADGHGLPIESYDPRGAGLESLLQRLRTTPGHHLVVGHSNTTPAVVDALGGDPVSAIEEDEYDRLYVVVLVGSEAVSSALIRFGDPWRGGEGR
jgi:phosphohistidine phosphatase SixA